MNKKAISILLTAAMGVSVWQQAQLQSVQQRKRTNM